jgi:exosome complex component RRP45
MHIGRSACKSSYSHLIYFLMGKNKVWHIRVTLHFLSDSGNMLDCACLAAMTALKHFRRPDVEVVGEEVIVVCQLTIIYHDFPDAIYKHDPNERAPVALSLNHLPLCLSFTYYTPPLPTDSTVSKKSSTAASSSPIIILDPTTLEQTLAEGTLSIALTKHADLCVVQKAGGIPLTVEEVMHVTRVGVERVREVNEIIEQRLSEDWSGRRVEVR